MLAAVRHDPLSGHRQYRMRNAAGLQPCAHGRGIGKLGRADGIAHIQVGHHIRGLALGKADKDHLLKGVGVQFFAGGIVGKGWGHGGENNLVPLVVRKVLPV